MIKNEEPKLKKQKIKIPKKERVKKFHYKKIADERIQKILVISLSTLIITIFGLGVFLSYKESLYPQPLQKTSNKLQQTSPTLTPDTTTSWKKYTNSTNNYSFLYSNSTELDIQECDDNHTIMFNPNEQAAEYYRCHADWYQAIDIFFQPGDSANESYYNSEEFTNSVGQINKDWKIEFEHRTTVNPQDTLIAHLKFIGQYQEDGCCPNFTQARIHHNQKTYIISQGMNNYYTDIFNQILSTFKFLD